MTFDGRLNLELILYIPCHNKKNTKNNKKNNKKSPRQNLPERSKLQVWTFEHGLFSKGGKNAFEHLIGLISHKAT